MNVKFWIGKTEEFPCPTCKTGRMIWTSKNVIVSETLESKKDNQFHKNGLVFPYTTSLISSHLTCDHCKDVMLGAYKSIDDVRNVDEEGNEINIYEVLYLDPAPRIIAIPETCTQNIRDLIEQSFKLFWVDINSCANKIRIALEALMDHVGIAREQANGKLISLGHRIKQYENTNPKTASFLTAIKWIGNESSHITGVTKEGTLAVYELLEHSLDTIFPDRENRLIELSNRINTKKGFSPQ